ncbi:MAG: DUF5340 family protein [Cyanobacteria bacterium P01_C01_bin.120]
MNEPLPLPSHVHYELLLQLLEQQTLFAAYEHPHLKNEVSGLIVTLRKALSQQRQLEEDCQRAGLEIDYRWSLNSTPDTSIN